jgi:hypothetical protein
METAASNEMDTTANCRDDSPQWSFGDTANCRDDSPQWPFGEHTTIHYAEV